MVRSRIQRSLGCFAGMVVSAEIVHLVVDAGNGIVRVHFLTVDAGRVVQDPLVAAKADGRWWCGREWELLC